MPITRSGYADRGTTTQRGYGHGHRKTRAALEAAVASGNTRCARCGRPIKPGQPWDLDHTPDRTGYLGASHAHCNRARLDNTRG